VYKNVGLADLTPDPKRFVSQMEVVDRFFDCSSCELVEGSVGGAAIGGFCDLMPVPDGLRRYPARILALGVIQPDRKGSFASLVQFDLENILVILEIGVVCKDGPAAS
jgi:hypothetical protein